VALEVIGVVLPGSQLKRMIREPLLHVVPELLPTALRVTSPSLACLDLCCLPSFVSIVFSGEGPRREPVPTDVLIDRGVARLAVLPDPLL